MSVKPHVPLRSKRITLVVAALLAMALLTIRWTLPLTHEFNADALYALALVKDVVANGSGAIWVLTPANSLVPDVALTAAGLGLGLDGYDNLIFVFTGFVLLLGASCFYMLQAAGCEFAAALSGAVLMVVISVFGGQLNDPLSIMLISPGHHQSTVALSMFAIGLQLSLLGASRQSRVSCAITLSALIAVAVFSDSISLVQIVAPLLAFAGLLLLSGARASAALSAASVGVGAVAGVAAVQLFEKALGYTHGDLGVRLEMQTIRDSAITFLAQFHRVLKEMPGPLRSTFVVLSLASLLGLATYWGVRSRGASFVWSAAPRRFPGALVSLTLISTVAAIIAPVAAGLWKEPAYYRQQLPMFFLPGAAMCGLAMQRQITLWKHPTGMRMAAALSTLALLGVFARADPVVPERPFLERHRALAARLESQALTATIAEYWEAKPLRIASNFDLQVCQINTSGMVYPWIVDMTWCAEVLRTLQDPSSRVAVVGSHLTTLRPLELFGPPLSTEVVGDFTLWYYPGPRMRGRLLAGLCDEGRARLPRLLAIARCGTGRRA